MCKQFYALEMSLLDALQELSMLTNEYFVMDVLNAEADTALEFEEFRQHCAMKRIKGKKATMPKLFHELC